MFNALLICGIDAEKILLKGLQGFKCENFCRNLKFEFMLLPTHYPSLVTVVAM